MPDFLIKGDAANGQVEAERQITTQLQELADKITNVKSHISFKIQAAEQIGSQLGQLIHDVERQSNGMTSLKSVLEGSIMKYRQTEQIIMSHYNGLGTIDKDAISGSSSGNTTSFHDDKGNKDQISGDNNQKKKDGPEYGKSEAKGEATAEFDPKEGKVGAGISGSYSISAVQDSIKGQYGLASGEIKGAVGTLALSGEAACVLFDKGKFDPKLALQAKAEAKGANVIAEGKLGTEDYNVHGEAEGVLGHAKAEGNLAIDKTGVKAKAEVGAAALHGEAKAGFTIAGVNIDVTGEGELASVGAKFEFGADEDEFEIGGKLSALAGLGLKLKVSW